MKEDKGSFVYAEIRSFLRNQIYSGTLTPGDMLPSEKQLCTQFGASRETVRKGLKDLENEGLIYSLPKVGYYVNPPDHQNWNVHPADEAEGNTVTLCSINGVFPDEALQKHLHIGPDCLVIAMTRVARNRDGIPYSLLEQMVPYEKGYPSVESSLRYSVMPQKTASKLSSYDYYVELSVGAVLASEKIAETLSCNPGEALLLIERVIVRQDGKRVGFEKQYLRQPYGRLQGTSGSRRKDYE